MPNGANIYINKVLMDFWHDMAYKYIPIKNEIIKKIFFIKKHLFHTSNNILGILIRGTDYLVRKPKHHAIQPDYKDVIKDTLDFDNKNKYDYIFLATEDEKIREEFIKKFPIKLKYLKNKKINYNYKKKKYLALNINVKGNINFTKIYLMNVIIVSQSLDIICSRTNGSVGVFVLTNGFRNIKVYYIGNYD